MQFALRPIHYLGSKLRIITPLREAIESLAPPDSPMCDLFAGSGTVAAAFSMRRSVTAVDIQEYSRVLCSAMLNPAPLSDWMSNLETRIRGSDILKRFNEATAPLQVHEAYCTEQAQAGNLAPLANLIDFGSLYASKMQELPDDKRLRQALSSCNHNLEVVLRSNGSKGLITRYFGGVYFSYHQAITLDSILETLTEVDPAARDSALAPLLSTASSVVNTVGKHFAQPIRLRTKSGAFKKHLVSQILRDRSMSILDTYLYWTHKLQSISRSTYEHTAIRADYRDFLANLKDKSLGVVYADPPYTRDHYSRYYHVLETICLQDDPQMSVVKIHGNTTVSRGLYRQERHQSPFSIISQASRAFDDLFREVRALGVPLALSYSPFKLAEGARPRAIEIKDLMSLANKYFSKTGLIGMDGITHSKLNARNLNIQISSTAEILILCEP